MSFWQVSIKRKAEYFWAPVVPVYLMRANRKEDIAVLEPEGDKSENDDKEETIEQPTDDTYSNAPGYCFIVLDGEIVAGGILCNAKLVERTDTARVGSIFVRPAYRRRGIAQALMLTAFDAFWKSGFRRVITDTDANSFTDSTKLYTGLGMESYRREFTYEKEIRPGKEVRRLDS